jgi:hypothetical protein
MKLKYIGNKPLKTLDVGNGTTVVWNGKGDVQEVPDGIAATMLQKHYDVWEATGNDDADPHTKAPPKRAFQAASGDDSLLSSAVAQTRHTPEDVAVERAKHGIISPADQQMREFAKKSGIEAPDDLVGPDLEKFITDSADKRSELQNKEAQRLAAQSSVVGAGSPEQVKASADANKVAMQAIEDSGKPAEVVAAAKTAPAKTAAAKTAAPAAGSHAHPSTPAKPASKSK